MRSSIRINGCHCFPCHCLPELSLPSQPLAQGSRSLRLPQALTTPHSPWPTYSPAGTRPARAAHTDCLAKHPPRACCSAAGLSPRLTLRASLAARCSSGECASWRRRRATCRSPRTRTGHRSLRRPHPRGWVCGAVGLCVWVSLRCPHPRPHPRPLRPRYSRHPPPALLAPRSHPCRPHCSRGWERGQPRGRLDPTHASRRCVSPAPTSAPSQRARARLCVAYHEGLLIELVTRVP